jgi:hypothetical protein
MRSLELISTKRLDLEYELVREKRRRRKEGFCFLLVTESEIKESGFGHLVY